ncbi:MAG: hypothetical protein OXI80_18000 [Caldilineaceae bacterium]|nr:hypothetical protein [Caldilineaceae bacterium]MDE0339574.1 hypothetical protein [Caldilineaceae bacterium]
MATIRLSIPESLHTTVLDIVEREGMSFEQFITLAMAEKASAIATEAYIEARAVQGSREKFLAAMAKVADVEPADEKDRL